MNDDVITIQIPRALLTESSADTAAKATTEPKWMTVAQYAESRALHPETVRRYIHAGMPSMRAGKGFRVNVAQADAWLEAGGAAGAARRKGTAQARRGPLQ